MKTYPPLKQETWCWCLPASLQIVLASKGINIPQEEIAHGFGMGREDTFKAGDKDISRFLRRFDLNLSKENYNTAYPDIENWIEENSPKDILIAYYPYMLTQEGKFERGRTGHFSVLSNLYLDEKNVHPSEKHRVKIWEPHNGVVMDYSFCRLVRAMPPQHSSCGFYAIGRN